MDAKCAEKTNTSYTENHGEYTEDHREKYSIYSFEVLCATLCYCNIINYKTCRFLKNGSNRFTL